MKIRREAPASAKAERLSGTPPESPRGWTEPSDNRNNLYQSSSGAFEESSMSFFRAHSTVLGCPLAFSGAPAMTLTISKGLCNVSVGVSNALLTGSSTQLHAVEHALSLKSPTIVRRSRCVWWLQLYSPSALRTAVSSNHLCLGGSDSPFNAALPLHAFCTQVQVNFRNGTSPAPSLSHFLLQCEEILKPGQILLITPQHESWSEPPHHSCRGRAKQCRQVFRSQTDTSAWYLAKERRADVEKEDRVVTGGAAITQESRGEENQLWGGQPEI